MAVANTNSSVSYNGDGGTKAFPTTFKFLAAADLVVKTTTAGVATTLVLGADYNVDGAGNDEPGGTVTTTAAPAIGTVLSITRRTPIVQPVVLAQSGPIPVKSVSTEFDRLTLILQEHERRIAALESLQSLLIVTTTANAVAVDIYLPGADPVESNFPMVVAVANGGNARQVLMRVEDDGDDGDFTSRAPALNWRPGPGANEITVLFVSDLKANNDYLLSLLVLF